MGTLRVSLRDGSENTLADVARLLDHLGVTGTPAYPIFHAHLDGHLNQRKDTIVANLATDPHVASVR
jgi:hypothetical protein